MQLTAVLVRFFKSFNFDYERKAHHRSVPKKWELIDGHWFPFIEVLLDPSVTAVVGANESERAT